ncbi:tetratricopeptide repeat-containing sensor histidine kinase [Formosa sp. 4Alg 33]|uniref:tetratricopeptide repeat-containing sensor histidine kinase n=1 Tax=Formosa sp. 4Alg 33 TaxID=3382189 RepID=UPI003D9C0C7E
MKLLKNTSLLFFVCTMLLIPSFNLVYSQNKQIKDSLSYFIETVANPKNITNLSRAYLYFEKLKYESLKKQDTNNVLFSLQHLSKVQYSLGDYFGSENSVVEGLSVLAVCDGDTYLNFKLSFLNKLGKISAKRLDYDTAIQYYNQAIAIAKDQEHLNIIHNNKALIYVKQEKYELAEQEFKGVYENSLGLDNDFETNKSLNNLGFVQSKLNKPEGLTNMLKALELKKAINHSTGLYWSYSNLSEYYRDQNDIKQAKFYADKSYELAKQINSPALIKQALAKLIAINGDEYAQVYLAISDSLSVIQQLQENKYSKIKYDYSRNEQLANVTEIEKERQKRWKLTYLSIGIFLAFMSGVAIVFQKLKYRREKIQQVYITEKRISKKIHDEVANDVHRVINKLQFQSHISEDIMDDLDHIYTQTRDISKENSHLDVEHNFEELLNDLLLSYKTSEVNIITKTAPEINWNKIEAYKKVTIFRLIQELLVNMKKHSNASIVVLKFSKSRRKIVVAYSDNGNGCEIKKGSGVQNMETRIKSTNGTITFESEPDKGFKAKITI